MQGLYGDSFSKTDIEDQKGLMPLCASFNSAQSSHVKQSQTPWHNLVTFAERILTS